MEDDLENGNEIFAYVLSLRIREYRTKLCDSTADKLVNRSLVERFAEKES